MSAELGFQTDTASLADIYAHAQQLGFGLAKAGSLRNSGFNILTSRSVNFSSEWSHDQHVEGRARHFNRIMAERDWSSSARMAAPTQKYPWRPVFCSCGPMKPH